MESPMRPDDRAEGPTRADEERTNNMALARLLQRGLDVAEWATSEQLVTLLDAVEAFEAVTRARGSDSFTNSLESSQPDDPEFVLPNPRDDDTIESYIGRVAEQTQRIERGEV
jgi:hypothetical protein